jgi:hypothetical protein
MLARTEVDPMSRNGNGNAVATNLSDDLVAKARAIASRSDELLELLEDARQKLVETGGRGSGRARKAAAPPRSVKTDKKADQTDHGPAKAKSTGSQGVPEGLRLLTTQMSVAGASRDEIAAALKDEFGITDPDPILKSIGL